MRRTELGLQTGGIGVDSRCDRIEEGDCKHTDDPHHDHAVTRGLWKQTPSQRRKGRLVMFEGIQSHVAHQEHAQQEERGALSESIRELRLIHTDGYHLGHVHG